MSIRWLHAALLSSMTVLWALPAGAEWANDPIVNNLVCAAATGATSTISAGLTCLPSSGTLVGSNVFSLVAQDVTPAPYNQPPYPPAGDTDSADCTVIGMAP